MDIEGLILQAIDAREKSYSPYSGFKVGAALLTKDGKVYCGANIENAAFSPTNCAERTAFFKAVFDGHREFSAIAVVGGAGDEIQDYCYPCGVCRQVMREFCDENTFEIYVAIDKGRYRKHLLKELLPESFGPDNLE